MRSHGGAIQPAWLCPASPTRRGMAVAEYERMLDELSAVCRRYRTPIIVGWMMFLGIALGFGTDFVLEAVGG